MVANVQDKFWVHTRINGVSLVLCRKTEHSSRFTWKLLCSYIFFVFIAANWLYMKNIIFVVIYFLCRVNEYKQLNTVVEQ